jgi:hypothetical protein
MPIPPIVLDAAEVDLHRRFLGNSTVVGSPAAAAETTIASLTISDNFAITQGVFIEFACAFTVGTNGTAVTLKLHQTNAAGTTLYSSGAVNATAANLMNMSAQALDASPTLPGQIYIATLQVTGGSAASTVSAVSIFCTVI